MSSEYTPENNRRYPPGIALIRRIRGADWTYDRYRWTVLFVTFMANAAYQASRKPNSIVKSALASTPAYPNEFRAWPVGDIFIESEAVMIGNNSAQNTGWAPFNTTGGTSLLGLIDLAFLTCYAMSMYAAGRLGDGMDLRIFLSIGMVGSGIFVSLFGMGNFWDVHNFFYYLVVQMVAGLFQATGWPSVVAVVGNWHGNMRRGLIMGAWNSNTSLGNIAGSLIASVALGYGWGWSFVVPGAFIFLSGGLVFLFLPAYPEDVGFQRPNDSQMTAERVLRTTDEPSSGDEAMIAEEPPSGNEPGITVEPPSGNDPGITEEPPSGNEPGIKEEPPSGNEPGITEEPPSGNEPGITEEPPSGNEPGITQEPPSGNEPGITQEPLSGGEQERRHPPENPGNRAGIGFLEACDIPGVIPFAICLFFAKMVAYTFVYWLPYYISHTVIGGKKMSVETAGNLSTLFDVGGIIGAVLAGYLSDFLGGRAITASIFLSCAIPAMMAYRTWGGISRLSNIVLMMVAGLFVSGPCALITTAVCTDLGNAPGANGRALATVTAIIDGTGSIGAALGPLLTGLFSTLMGWDAVFKMLVVGNITAALFITHIAVAEVRRIRRDRHNRNTEARQPLLMLPLEAD